MAAQNEPVPLGIIKGILEAEQAYQQKIYDMLKDEVYRLSQTYGLDEATTMQIWDGEYDPRA
jgi:hypothetical protein